MKKSPRLGRPPEFTHRARLTVFLDTPELERIHAMARAERLSASKLARRLLVAASREGTPMKRARRRTRRKRRKGGR